MTPLLFNIDTRTGRGVLNTALKLRFVVDNDDGAGDDDNVVAVVVGVDDDVAGDSSVLLLASVVGLCFVNVALVFVAPAVVVLDLVVVFIPGTSMTELGLIGSESVVAG